MGVAAEIGQHLLGPAEGWLGVDNPVEPAERIELPCKADGVRQLGKTRLPALKALWISARNRRRKRRDSTCTGRKKSFLQATQRLPSSEGPPPDTTQWTWG